MRYIILLLGIIFIILVMSKCEEGLTEYSFTDRIALGNIVSKKDVAKSVDGISANKGDQKCEGPKRACKKVNKAIK